MLRCRNTLGDREYQAARLGHISDETQLVLDSFGFQPPVLISSMYTQVRDLNMIPRLPWGQPSLSRAWSVLQENGSLPGIPVAKDDGTLYGMLLPEDIAEYDMQTIYKPQLDRVPVFNLLSVLEGKLLDEGERTLWI